MGCDRAGGHVITTGQDSNCRAKPIIRYKAAISSDRLLLYLYLDFGRGYRLSADSTCMSVYPSAGEVQFFAAAARRDLK